MNNPVGYIYLTTNLINNKKYIGKHKKTFFDTKYYGSGILIKKAIDKYGLDNFRCEVILWCYSEDELNEAEKYLITFYNAVADDDFYNLKEGGKGGKPHSMVGELNPMYGRKHKLESKQKMGHKNNQGAKGYKWNDEQKLHASIAHLGSKYTHSIAVKCVETGEIFETLGYAANFTGLAGKQTYLKIKECCEGTRKTCGGYHWKYIN